jgi:hypothetical protein
MRKSSRVKSSEVPYSLEVLLETDACRRVLVETEFFWTPFDCHPAQYLHDHDAADYGTSVALSLGAVRAAGPDFISRRKNLEEYWKSREGSTSTMNAAGARILVKRLFERWDRFVRARDNHFAGSKISLPGLLIRHGGAAVLPFVEELLKAGSLLEPRNVTDASVPFVASVVDHFLRRRWVEKSLDLPRTKVMEEFRKVLLWLADKTGDRLQINWQAP